MEYYPIDAYDTELIQVAIDLIKGRYEYKRHHVSAAIRTKRGKIIQGLHLDTTVRRAAICAEAAALSIAVAENNQELETIVAVRQTNPYSVDSLVEVVSPCGFCRELLMDYANDIRVIIDKGEGQLVKCDLSDLLPHKYRNKDSNNGHAIELPHVYINQLTGRVVFDATE